MGHGRGPEGPEHTSLKVQEALLLPAGSPFEEPLVALGSLPKKPAEPGLHCCHKLTVLLRRVTRTHLMAFIAVLILILASLVFLVVQTGSVKGSAAEDLKECAVLPPCDEDMIWHRNKCYYFSKVDGTWTEAEDSCAALNSSLGIIDTKEELSFMMRYKGAADHWIGLKRDSSGQPWKWVDGTLFNKTFTVEDFSECAYLNEKTVRSAGCGRIRHWICTKEALYERKRKKRTLNMQHFR